MKRILTIYGIVTFIFILGVGITFYVGGDLSLASSISSHTTAAAGSVWSDLSQNFHDPLARLLVQFIVVIISARILGKVFARVGQPAVIGEIVAGILLGPSLLGWFLPNVFTFVFPKESLGVLQLFSQIGVCVFMFVVGLELDVDSLRRRAQTAVVVSHSSIMVPFLLGVVSSLLLYKSFAGLGTTFIIFALFMGLAMSITAFPVLVRILNDRGLSRTPLGAIATTCAAVGDATAWVILAFVVALARAAGLLSTAINLFLLAVFVIAVFSVARPLLTRLLTVERAHDGRAPGIVAAVLVFMTGSALATQAMGIHALFGAFLAGVAMPRSRELRNYLSVRLENFATVFLLPLFFAFSGLRTQVDLINDAKSLFVFAGIVAVAVIGKLVGSMVPARLTGMSWNEALSLGALMNTRGLIELIALNVGYDLGILPPRIFSMMVLMALVTTLMTGPLLRLADVMQRREVDAVASPPGT